VYEYKYKYKHAEHDELEAAVPFDGHVDGNARDIFI